MIQVTIYTSASHAAVLAALRRISREMLGGRLPARKMIDNVGLALLKRIRQAFLVKSAGGTDDTGERWAPLKNTTIVYKRRRSSRMPRDILQDTGRLLNSLSPDVGGPDRVFVRKNGEVSVGTRRRGAIYHHRGIPGRLPQRRLWPAPQRWTPLWWNSILREIQLGAVEIAGQLIKEAR